MGKFRDMLDKIQASDDCTFDCDNCTISICHDAYVRNTERWERRVNKLIVAKYGNKKMRYKGMVFEKLTVRKGKYVIPLSPTTYRECMWKNKYMLAVIEKSFEQGSD